MVAMKIIERENEILRIIKKFVDAKLDFLLVGGYAVSGLARHRFSVDCDFVISKRELEKCESILEKEGFRKHVEKAGFDEIYGGEFVSYVKKINGLPVTVDFLVESLVCKATTASWSFDYIRKHSVLASIPGIEASVTCRIPEKELLIAFKIHSARRADVRDIVMLREEAELEKVIAHLRKGSIEALKRQINKIIKASEDKNLVDSLKGVFTLTVDVNKQIENTRKDLEEILRKM